MSKSRVTIDKESLAEIVKQVLDEQDKQKYERAKRKRDRRLRNTDLLLRNYDNLITHIEYAVEDEKKLEEDTEELLEDIDNEIEIESEDEYEGIYIGAIKRTKTRTRIIVNHIEAALEFYKQKSKNDEVSRRRYNVIYKYYCEKKKIPQIAEELRLSEKTIGRDKKRAVEELSVLFFGIDGVKFMI